MTRNVDPRYNSTAYRKAKKAFFASVPPVCTWPECSVPGRIVDMSLSGNHRYGPTVDHAVATSRGGDFWGGWQLMHRRCNLVKGDRPMPDRRASAVCRCGQPTSPSPEHSHACW